jgi:hypothetical protein
VPRASLCAIRGRFFRYKPITIDVPEATAATDDTGAANSTGDTSASPSADVSAVETAPFTAPAASDESSGSTSEDGAVLEIPRVVNLPSNSNADNSAEQASANANGAEQASANADSDEQASANANDEDDSAQSGQDGQDAAANDDVAAAAGQVGTLEDYRNQASAAPVGPILFGPGIAIIRFPRQPAANPQPLVNRLPQPPWGAPMAMSPIILPPTSGGPFPSTSPMLMAPRPGSFGVFAHSGGLTGFRR